MKQPEATFKKQLNEAFAEVFPLGWYAYVKGLARSGVPDLHYQISGHPGVWVEAKVGDNPLRSTQEREINRMALACARVCVVRLVKDSKAPWQVGVRRVTTALLDRETFCNWSDRKSRGFWIQILDR